VRTPEEAWHGIKDSCDALIFPYLDPPGAMERMYSIHFPSKLPEYLAVGMPIVMVGPDCATGARWAKRHPSAVLTLDSQAPEAWPGQFQRLAAEADLRCRLGSEALKAGAKDFDPVAIRSHFLALLSEVSHASRAVDQHCSGR